MWKLGGKRKRASKVCEKEDNCLYSLYGYNTNTECSREFEISVDGEEGRSILSEGLNGDVVGGWRGHGWNIEWKAVWPAAWVNRLDVSEVFVVDEGAEEVTLEIHVVNVNWLGPETAKSEVDSCAELKWVWVSESLAGVHEEDAISVDLLENHRVWNWGFKVEGFENAMFEGCDDLGKVWHY